MIPLRAYLLHWQPDDGWNLSVHRDLDSIRASCALADFERDQSVIIHVGFWRPDADCFMDVVERFPGTILVTSSAKAALPPPLETSTKPVSVIEGLGLYPILSGWGYETSESELGIAGEGHPSLQSHGNAQMISPIPMPRMGTSEWMLALAAENQEAFTAAQSSNIYDDDSFFANENSLPDKLRTFLYVYRFRSITGELPSPANVLDWLHLASPTILNTPLSNFELSVRATNIFKSFDIQYIHEIAKLKTDGLYELRNMGKKTVTELATLMMNYWLPGYREEELNRLWEKRELPEQPIRQAHLQLEDSATATIAEPEDSFAARFDQALDRLPGSRKTILCQRIGLNGEPKILEAIGRELGISRERVRQLENASIEVLKRNPLFSTDLIPRISRLLDNRHSPLPMFGLEVLDPWFSGFSDKPFAFNWLLEHCCDGAVSVINHNNQHFVTRIRQSQWDDLLESTASVMKAQVESRIVRSQARSLVYGMLIGPGEELREELWGTICLDLNFSGEGGEDDLLVSVGSDLSSLVEAVLLESPVPLHISEIGSRVQTRSGLQCDEKRLRKILRDVGFQFSRGTYGLRSHLSLSDQELDLLRVEIESVITSADSQRQWHASEIYSFMEEACPDLYPRINPHVIGIALRRSEVLTSLGRMVWTAKQSGSTGTAFRIDIHQAIVSLIRSEGRPMPSGEIRQRLLRDRGLNSVFQIPMEEPLIRVDRGVWGLMDRDIPYDKSEQEDLVGSMLLLLTRRQRGIHSSVLLSELSKYTSNLLPNVQPALLMSLAQYSGSMKVDMAGYLYISDWGSSRWPSNTEVVSEIIAKSPGMGWTSADILQVAEEQLERPLEPAFVLKAIESIGGVYNLDAKKWFFPSDLAGQGEDD